MAIIRKSRWTTTGLQRAIRPGTIGRKNYYGSASGWSAQLLARMLTLLQTLVLHRINPRTYLTAYLEACALNGSKAPQQLEPWLPWNFMGQEATGVEGPPPSTPARGTRARAP